MNLKRMSWFKHQFGEWHSERGWKHSPEGLDKPSLKTTIVPTREKESKGEDGGEVRVV